MIHPSAFIAPTAVVLGDVTIDADASVWYHAVIRGDIAPIRIGSESNVQDGSVLHVDPDVPCTVGRRVGVGHRVVLHGCTIEDECLIGMGSVVLNHVRVGAGSVIAAGAVIPEGVAIPPGSLVMGVPGRVVRPVDAALRERVRSTWAHYVEVARAHRAGRYARLGGGVSEAPRAH